MTRISMSAAILASVTVLCAASADPASYYLQIQKDATASVSEDNFKAQEQEALDKFTQPDEYRGLCLLFSKTTERVWAVVYGEVYLNIAQDEPPRNGIASLVFGLYDSGIKVGNSASLEVSFSKYAEARQDGGVPFETNFEISLGVGIVSTGPNPKPLTIKALSDARLEQLHVWGEKQLPTTELIRWQQAVVKAGHFEAYNYWLFQAARKDEFLAWRGQHKKEYSLWVDWVAKNRFTPKTPDFHRLFLSSNERREAGRVKGFDCWSLGMTKDQVKACSQRGPYTEVKVTGGL